MFYALRNRLNYERFKRRTRSIHASPPLACNPEAACQVQTMLGRADLPLYLVAVKSLLRWYADVAVMVHSDGSLDRDTQAILRRHVPGVRIIDAEEADRRAREALRDRPFLARWRAHDAAYRRLIDTEIWSTAPKRIILDADVLVLREPREAIDWITSGSTPFLLGQPPPDEGAPLAPPSPAAHVQEHFRYAVPKIAELTGMPPRFLQGTTAGFHGCSSELSLDKVERVLSACESLQLPMTQWGGDQCLVIYLLSAAGAVRLNVARCFNFDPSTASAAADAEIIHFYGTNRFYRGIYPALAAQVASELRAASTSPGAGRSLPTAGQ